MLSPANVVYFSICFFYGRSLSTASGTADGGIATDSYSALIVNTMKYHSCVPLNGSKDISHFVSTMNPPNITVHVQREALSAV